MQSGEALITPDLRLTGSGLRPAMQLGFAVVLTGIAAGLSAMTLALILHAVQRAAFGYDLGPNGTPESFLQGVTAAPPLRRAICLLLCGALAGLGWWALDHWRDRLISIEQAADANAPGPPMPFLKTVAHALLQILTVALGSPLGREVAPREVGALFAQRIGNRFALQPADIRLIIACGAGGGLGAIYNVPLAGAVFALEVLLNTIAIRACAAALCTSAIAVAVAQIGLGNTVQYTMEPANSSLPLLAWAVLAGPLLGLTGKAFRLAARACAASAPKGMPRLPASLILFACIGLLATAFPQLPGNGRGPIQMALSGSLALSLAGALLLLKIVAVLGALRTGSTGGLLTPGMTLGALAAFLLGGAWNVVAPALPLQACALIGGAAFLASSMRMPIAAIVLTIEFSRFDHNLVMAVVIAVGGSVAARNLVRLPGKHL